MLWAAGADLACNGLAMKGFVRSAHGSAKAEAQNARCHAPAEAYHYPSGAADATGGRAAYSRTAGILQLINTAPIFAAALKRSHNYLYVITAHRPIAMPKLFSSERSIFFYELRFPLRVGITVMLELTL